MPTALQPKSDLAGQSFQAIFPGTSQKVATTGTSAQSAALSSRTNLVRVYADADMFLAFGANPTAVADGTNLFLAAGVVEYFGVTPSDKIAAIQATAAGNLYITEAKSS